MNRFFKLFIILFAIILALYFSANYVLKETAKTLIERLKPDLEKQGIILEEIHYKSVKLNSIKSCSIKDFELKFHLNRELYGKKSYEAHFTADYLNIYLAGLKNPSVFFTLKNFRLDIVPEESEAKKTFGKFENGYLKSRIPIYLKDPQESAKEVLEQINLLFKENIIYMDIELESDILLGIDNKEVKVGLFTVKEDTITRMKFNADDILDAADKFNLDLTEKEAEIISDYPNKVPALIKITRDAKRLSSEAKEKDSDFPEDAFRHLYWSYNLTKEFGPEFARKITDAHETEKGNTEEEHKMDYHNNEVARQYANKNLSIDALKKKALYAKEVIRQPNEVNNHELLGQPDK